MQQHELGQVAKPSVQLNKILVHLSYAGLHTTTATVLLLLSQQIKSDFGYIYVVCIYITRCTCALSDITT